PGRRTCGPVSGAKWSKRRSLGVNPFAVASKNGAKRRRPTSWLSDARAERRGERLTAQFGAAGAETSGRRDAQLADHLAHGPVGDAGPASRLLPASALGQQAP